MKELFLLTCLFTSMAGFTQSKNELAIRGVLLVQTAAWNRGDVEDFMKGYWENDSLTFIGKSGITYGWANALKNYKKGYPDTVAMGKLNFKIITVKRLSSKYYQVVGKWHLQRSIGDLNGHYTLLFKKIKRHWLIIADHSS